MNKQQQAINEYLEALLQEVPDEPLIAPAPVREPLPPTIGVETLVKEVARQPVETEIQPVVDIPVQQPVLEVQAQAVAKPAEKLEPDWAREAFQCLLFKVSGLSLAVPLSRLNGVISWPEKIVATPNQTDWYLGLVLNHGTNVKVIDTAHMVLPENRRPPDELEPAERFSHILLVDDARWGLACDSIGDVIWLQPEAVKWRRNKDSRPWLAGTALEYLCALMDTQVFAEMLDQQTAT